MFAFADGYLFRPLPFPGADRLDVVRAPRAPIAAALRARLSPSWCGCSASSSSPPRRQHGRAMRVDPAMQVI
jgi:hypothetical protein